MTPAECIRYAARRFALTIAAGMVALALVLVVDLTRQKAKAPPLCNAGSGFCLMAAHPMREDH